MLLAHVVPGYFVATTTTTALEWHPWQRRALWVAAVGSTVAPDTDVIYNALFRGFVNHSTLYTHSLFVHCIPACFALIFCFLGRKFLAALCLVIMLGGMSHLLLDVIAHNTPLFYPLSTRMIGDAPLYITGGGLRHYMTHPLFLLEPFLLLLMAIHWIRSRAWPPPRRAALTLMLIGGWLLSSLAFMVMLPWLRSVILWG